MLQTPWPRLFFLILAGCWTLGGCASLTEDEVPPEARALRLERIWARETVRDGYLGPRLPNRAGPLLADNMLIQGNGVDAMAAYDRQSGVELWRLAIKGGVEGGTIRIGEYIFFGGGDGRLYCLKTSGEVVWQIETKAPITSTPMFYDGVVYVVNSADELFAVEASQGTIQWTYRRPTARDLSVRGASTPAVRGDSIYVGFSDGVVARFQRASGKLIWEKPLREGQTEPPLVGSLSELGVSGVKLVGLKNLSDVDATPIIENDRVYVSSYQGGLFCLQADSGAILWSRAEGGIRPVTIHQDRLYYASAAGNVLALDKSSGKLLWQYQAKGMASGLVLTRGRLVFGESSAGLTVLNAVSGTPLVTFLSGRGVSASPAISDQDWIYFISNENNLYALREAWQMKTKELSWDSY